MNIKSIKSKTDLESFYRERRASSTAERVELLRHEMKIRAIRGGSKNEEMDLVGLEEVALMGIWPALC